jgi:hypothetical protein
MSETCGICRDDFGDLPKNQLECHKDHCFHSACINKWIVESKVEQAECPICRKKIFPQKEKIKSLSEIPIRDLANWKCLFFSLISNFFETWSARNPFSLFLFLIHQIIKKKLFGHFWRTLFLFMFPKLLYRFYFCKFFNFNLEIVLIWALDVTQIFIIVIAAGYKCIF